MKAEKENVTNVKEEDANSISLDGPIFSTAVFYLPKLVAILHLESYVGQAASQSNSNRNFTVTFRAAAALILYKITRS